MKKIILFLTMMAITACSGDSIGDDGAIIVSNDYISVSASSILLPGVENAQELTITANCKWVVTSDASWISIDSSSGEGNAQISISASLNSTGTERVGMVFVTTDRSKLEKKVRVTQGTPTSALVPTINDNQYPE